MQRWSLAGSLVYSNIQCVSLLQTEDCVHVAWLWPEKAGDRRGSDRFTSDNSWVWDKLVLQPPMTVRRGTRGGDAMRVDVVPLSSVEWAARPFGNTRFRLCSAEEAQTKGERSVAATFLALVSAIQQNAVDLEQVLQQREAGMEDDLGVVTGLTDVDSDDDASAE